MRRHALGIIALLLIIAGSILLLLVGVESMYASICLRTGLTLGAIWLAFPQVTSLFSKVPPWLLICSAVAIVVIVNRPRMFLYLAPVLAAIAALQFLGWLFTPLKSANASSKSSAQREDRKQ